MNIMSRSFTVFICMVSSICAADWVPLFDGKSLDGWVQHGGKANYAAVDGEIVGTTVPNTPNSFLCTKKHYGDFILELEFKVHPELNSGIQIRSNVYEEETIVNYKASNGETKERKIPAGRVHGYQVEIDASDRGWTAGLYDEGRRGWLDSHKDNVNARYAFKPGQWNHVRVLAAGATLRTWLNGVPAANLEDSLTPSGFIGLQVHGVGGRQDPISVHWRNIRIQELDAPLKLKREPEPKIVGQPVREGAEVRKIAGGFKFTEGPAEGPDGRIYFSDIPNERIHVYDPKTDKVSVFRENSGRANGLMFAPSGALIACEGGSRKVTRMFDGKLTDLADNFKGNKLNSPNDVTLDNNGGIYFTDPRYGNRDDMELQAEAVYYLAPRSRKIRRVIGSLVRPNGIILSLDRKTLYVVDNGAGKIFAYDVQPDASVTNRRLFVDDVRGDGMTIDEAGNVYCAGQGHIWIWNSDGALLKKIEMPEGPANCTFGGPDRKVLYITARTGFYSLQMNVAGGR